MTKIDYKSQKMFLMPQFLSFLYKKDENNINSYINTQLQLA